MYSDNGSHSMPFFNRVSFYKDEDQLIYLASVYFDLVLREGEFLLTSPDAEIGVLRLANELTLVMGLITLDPCC